MRPCDHRLWPLLPSSILLPHPLHLLPPPASASFACPPFALPPQVQAFFTELCAAYSGRRPDARKNVLSFGDSVHERAAVHRVTAGLGPATRTKSVKFVERPTLEQLKRQVDLVASCFEDIVRHDGHLDLMLTISLIYVGENEGGMGMGMGMGAGAAAASSSSGGGSPLLEDGAADAVGGGAGAGMAMGIDAGTAASSSMMAGLMTA